MSFITVGVASLWFADIAGALRAHEYVDGRPVALGSSVVFGSAVMSGGCCMALAQLP